MIVMTVIFGRMRSPDFIGAAGNLCVVGCQQSQSAAATR